MRLLLVMVGVFAAIVCIENPANAQNYPWCAYYNFGQRGPGGLAHDLDGGGATNCGFSTFQQCLATVSGIGGSCRPNPQYQGTPTTKHPRRHSY
jgi:hypothetical protein